MTECLMALSNPYKPVDGRLKGCVGAPLPGVEAALLSLEEASQVRQVLPQESTE